MNFKKIIIALAMVLVGSAIAGAFTVDGLNYSVSNGVATLTGATSRNITSVTIPATVTSGGKTYPVNKITYNAFQNYPALRSVRIADSDTYLGCQPYKYGGQMFYQSPFKNCPIEEYYIGRNLAFGGPTSVQVDYFVIGSSVDCVDITFGGKMTFIPARGFLFKEMDAGKLGGLTLGGELSNIHSLTFMDAINLKALTLKPGNYSIEASMFPDGHLFETLTLEKTYTSQGDVPLDAKHVVFGDAWTEIPLGFLENKKKLQKVTLPETIVKIEDNAFGNCNLLSEINFPNSLKEIGGYAFKGCKFPERLVIPNTVSKVGSSAFYGCSNIKEVEILPSADNPSITVNDRAFGGGSVNKLILGRTIQHDAYNTPFKECPPEEIIFGEAWTEIPSNLVNNMMALKTVTLPETVVKIADMAFYQCQALSSVNFPASLKEIGQMAFQDCTALSDIVLNEGLESIGHDAFRACTGPERLTIPSTVSKVDYAAFYRCSNIKEVEILPSVDNPSITVNDRAFGGGSVNKLILGRTIQHDAYNTPFKECSPEEIIFGEAWKDITNIGLGGKESLKSVSFPATLEHIGTNTFTGCPAVRHVECKAIVPPVCEADGQWFDSEVYGTAQLYIPLGSRKAYEAAVMWKNFTDIRCEGAHLVTAVYDKASGAVTLNGTEDTRIDVEDGFPLEIAITPGESYRISKVTLNDRDILSELDAAGRYTVDAVTEPHELNVKFEKKQTGIETVSDGETEGIDFAEPFEIYRLDGVRMYRGLNELTSGVYILRQNGIVSKINIK